MEQHYEFFRYLPFFNKVYAEVIDHVERCKKFLGKQIRVHQEQINLESDEEPNDYVEAFLRHQHKMNKEGVQDHVFTESQLHSALIDLWIAGQGTTSTTIAWIIIYVIQNPEVQRKAQAELTEHIGDRVVTSNDKTTLNYINAVIAESQRMANLIPVNVPHKTTRDVKIMGYKLPKGTNIIDQISTVLMDERYFPDAKSFKPERFLNDTGKFNAAPELMPFGVGKRACLGEGLARLKLFLFTANLLNQFEFYEVSEKPITAERIISDTIAPTPWVCSIRARY